MCGFQLGLGGCCGCKDLSTTLWPDIYRAHTVKCFVTERTVVETTTNQLTPAAVTTTTDVTEDSTDTRLRAGTWKWQKTELVIEPDESRTLIVTTIYETRRLAIQLDVSDQFSLGQVTESGLDIVTKMTAIFAAIRPTRGLFGNASRGYPPPSAYGIYADVAMPADAAAFDALVSSADASTTVASVSEVTPRATSLPLASAIPATSTDTMMILISRDPSATYGGIELTDFRLEMELNGRLVGNPDPAANWRQHFTRTAQWTYMSKQAVITPDSEINTVAIAQNEVPNSSPLTTTMPNTIVQIELFVDPDDPPVFSFTWDFRDEVNRVGVIPPGIPNVIVESDQITARHAGSGSTPHVFPVSPPAKKYYIRVTLSGNYLRPDLLNLTCTE